MVTLFHFSSKATLHLVKLLILGLGLGLGLGLDAEISSFLQS